MACEPPSERSIAESPLLPEPAPLDVAFSGCERVLLGPICEVTAGKTLTLWMEAPFRGLELRAGSALLPVLERAVAGGYQVQVTPAATAGELSLWSSGQQRWRLTLAQHRASERLTLVRAARERGDAAFIEAQAAAARGAGEALEALLAQGVLARLWLRQGRAEDAAASLERTAQELFAMGQLSEASRDVFARLFILLQRSNAVAEARAWLEHWRQAVSGFPLGRALLADHEGMLRATLGEPVAASRAYRRAEREYERLGEVAHARRVRQEQVGLLSDVGDVEAALSLVGSLMPPLEEEAVCTKAQLFILQAWLGLLSAEDGVERRERQLPESFARSEEWEARCGDPEVVATGLVNRGLWALDRGDLKLAGRVERALAELPARRSPELVAWVHELSGRLALARGRERQARRAFEMEALIGKSSGRLDPELRASLGLARVADAEGALERGDQLLQEAVGALQRAERWSAFGSLVYGQLASRQRAARELTLRLVERGSLAEAWRVALSAYRAPLAVQARSRLSAWPAPARERWDARIGEYREARALLDRAAENDWQLSSAELRVAEARRHGERQRLELLLQQAAAERPDARAQDALPRPSPGEYWLLPLPLEASAGGGFVVLGTDGTETLAARIPEALLQASPPPPSDHPILAPFAAQLSRAERIVVLPAGRARALPIETFSLDGRPLSTRRLGFGAALGEHTSGAATSDAHAAPSPPARLPLTPSVSSDPRGDLLHSRREASWVATVLNIPDSRRLTGPEVTGSNVLAQLESSDFFHFAGHAQLSGPSREAALLLASGELQPWELFSLRSVPREVVLSACEAGEGSASGFGAGWGLAQAFLALGAETVIAPVQRVDDQQAFELQRTMYAAMRRGLPLREAFWSAHHDHKATTPTFRLFTR